MQSVLSREKVIELLKRLLEAYSPTGSEFKASRIASKEALKLGYEEAWVDDQGSFHAERGGSGPRVLLAGHIDTVPGFIDVRVEGDLIYGRGAVDAKGPLTSFILAGLLVEGCRVRISGLAGEEGDSRGALALLASKEEFEHIIVGEPTGLSIVIGYMGSNPLVIECRGTGGHASSPEVGDSALSKIIEVYESLKASARSSAMTMLRSTAAAHNVLPGSSTAMIDVRLERESLSLVLPRGCRVRALSYTPPVRVKPQAPIVRALQRAMLSRGLKPRLTVKRGTSDMNILASMTGSIVAFGPGDSRLSHSNIEYIKVSDVIEAAKIVADALTLICGGRL